MSVLNKTSPALVYGGKKFENFGRKKSPLLGKNFNDLIALATAFCNLKVTRGGSDAVIVGERSITIQLRESSSGTVAQTFRLKSVQANYLTCRSWDGTAEGTVDVFIAKNYKLRNSITQATIDGELIDYSYTNTVTRVATLHGTAIAETQVIVPRYLAGGGQDDFIIAIRIATGLLDGDGKPIELLDINVDARAWARKNDA